MQLIHPWGDTFMTDTVSQLALASWSMAKKTTTGKIKSIYQDQHWVISLCRINKILLMLSSSLFYWDSSFFLSKPVLVFLDPCAPTASQTVQVKRVISGVRRRLLHCSITWHLLLVPINKRRCPEREWFCSPTGCSFSQHTLNFDLNIWGQK